MQVAYVLKLVFVEWSIRSQLSQSPPESQTRARNTAQTKEYAQDSTYRLLTVAQAEPFSSLHVILL